VGIRATVPGMRSFEASLLKGSDIDSERRMIHFRRGNDARGRDLPQTPKLSVALREAWRWKRSEVYIFAPDLRDWKGRFRQDGLVRLQNSYRALE